MSTPIIPSNDIPVVDEQRKLEIAFRYFLEDLAMLVPLNGAGSPEGVVSAKSKRLYMDTSGVAGAILYIKQTDSVTNDSTLGWILV